METDNTEEEPGLVRLSDLYSNLFPESVTGDPHAAGSAQAAQVAL